MGIGGQGDGQLGDTLHFLLQEGFDFQEAGRRKNYYDLPKEDALILTRRFDEEAAQ